MLTKNGHVDTTFPAERRTEIDVFENGSSNIPTFTQHVLPWSAGGNILARLPADDRVTHAAGTEFDWHTFAFEWTPLEVKFLCQWREYQDRPLPC